MPAADSHLGVRKGLNTTWEIIYWPLPPCLLFFLSGKRNVSQPPKSLVTVFLGPHERAAMSHVLPVVGSNAHCFEFEARPTGEKGPGPKQRPLSPSQGPPQVTSSSVIPHAQVLSRIYVQIRRRVRCGVLAESDTGEACLGERVLGLQADAVIRVPWMSDWWYCGEGCQSRSPSFKQR